MNEQKIVVVFLLLQTTLLSSLSVKHTPHTTTCVLGIIVCHSTKHTHTDAHKKEKNLPWRS